MARKTILNNIHEFTKQINSTKRQNTRFFEMDNHNEKEAKKNKKVCCHDCRHFKFGCKDFIGMYHKTCNEFDWW